MRYWCSPRYFRICRVNLCQHTTSGCYSGLQPRYVYKCPQVIQSTSCKMEGKLKAWDAQYSQLQKRLQLKTPMFPLARKGFSLYEIRIFELLSYLPIVIQWEGLISHSVDLARLYCIMTVVILLTTKQLCGNSQTC